MTSPKDPTVQAAVDDILALRDVKKVDAKQDFAAFERMLRQKTMALEREVLAEHLRAADVDAPKLEIDGVAHRRVLRKPQTYLTSAGEVTIERTLYREVGKRRGKAVAALDVSIGVVAGYMTPQAAQVGLYLVASMTPSASEKLLKRVGTMQPSKSTLHRLANEMSEDWEANRENLEADLRRSIKIPEGTASISISLDGVLAPMANGGKARKREATEAAGRTPSGPAGYREVGCATMGFCDKDGELLSAIRFARAPEQNKRVLKSMLAAELKAVRELQPGLPVVKLADGAEDNWTFLSGEVSEGVEVVDFFHAVEHLASGLDAAYGEGSPRAKDRLTELRRALLWEDDGVEHVVRALSRLEAKHPRRTQLRRSVGYFRKHRHRMSYAALRKRGLPIGSGVIEAACKTVVGQRLKLSGMRWGDDGAQAILTPRGWVQSDRFDEAMCLLAATYKLTITTVDQVMQCAA
jgi:hypothetical protein